MDGNLRRSVNQPIRDRLTWSERWEGLDKGLIWCWERGRQMRIENPDLAARAESGELPLLDWKGGVEKKRKDGKPKAGTLYYLATWQGLRGDNLDLAPEREHIIVCTKTGQAVVFSAKLPKDEEENPDKAE